MSELQQRHVNHGKQVGWSTTNRTTRVVVDDAVGEPTLADTGRIGNGICITIALLYDGLLNGVG